MPSTLTVILAAVPAPLDGDPVAPRRDVQVVVDLVGTAQVTICPHAETDPPRTRRWRAGAGLARPTRTPAEMSAVVDLMELSLAEQSPPTRLRWREEDAIARTARVRSTDVQAVSAWCDGVHTVRGVAFADRWWWCDPNPVEDFEDADVVVVTLTPPAGGTPARDRYLAALATLEPLYERDPPSARDREG